MSLRYTFQYKTTNNKGRTAMNCKNCEHELTAVAEMDEYELCHHCYCKIMDTTNNNKGETK